MCVNVCLWYSRRFWILFFYHENNVHVKISFIKNLEIEQQFVCVGKADVYFYVATKKDQLTNGFETWWVACKKHSILIHMFFEALSKPRAVIADVMTYPLGLSPPWYFHNSAIFCKVCVTFDYYVFSLWCLCRCREVLSCEQWGWKIIWNYTH